MHKYVYRNKKTGVKIYTNQRMDNPDLELVTQIKDGAIKNDKVIKK